MSVIGLYGRLFLIRREMSSEYMSDYMCDVFPERADFFPAREELTE